MIIYGVGENRKPDMGIHRSRRAPMHENAKRFMPYAATNYRYLITYV